MRCVVKPAALFLSFVFPFTTVVDPALAETWTLRRELPAETLPSETTHFVALSGLAKSLEQNLLTAIRSGSLNDLKQPFYQARGELLSEVASMAERNDKARKFQNRLKERIEELTRLVDENAADPSALHTYLKRSPSIREYSADPYGNAAKRDRRATVSELLETRSLVEPSSAESNTTSADLALSAVSGGEEDIPMATMGSGNVSETLEVQFTDDIIGLAAALNASPARMYEYVANNIKYEPYFGSHKGAQETLLAGAGNDIDQASLLLSLLRSAGIPSYYVYGTIRLTLEEAMNLTGVTDPDQVVSLFLKNGIPVRNASDGESIEFDHVWVRAELTYDQYWGAVQNPSDTVLIDLDPSIVSNTYGVSQDVTNIIGVQPSTFLAGIISHPDSVINTTAFSATNLPQDDEGAAGPLAIIPQLRLWGEMIQEYMENHNIGSVTDFFRHARVEVEEYGIFPASRPFDLVQEWTTFDEIPNTLRHGIEVRLENPMNGNEIFTQTLTLPEVSGRRLILSYYPASPADEAELLGQLDEERLSLVTGIEVRPELYLDGTAGAHAPWAIVPIGDTQRLKVTFIPPSYPLDVTDPDIFTATLPIVAGSFHALAITSQGMSEQTLAEKKEELAVLLDEVNANPASFNLEAALGTVLDVSVRNLIYQENKLDEITAGAANVQVIKAPALHMASQNLRVETILGLPFSVGLDGITFKTLRDQRVPISVSGAASDEKSYLIASAMVAQALAQSTLEQVFSLNASSAASLMVEANETSIPVHTVKNLTEYNQIAPQMGSLSEDTRQDIQDALNNNKQVSFPSTPILAQGGEEPRESYVTLDLTTGASRYFFQGGIDAIAPHDVIDAAAVVVPDAPQKYAAFIDSASNWLGIVAAANLGVSLSFLPAADTILEWIRQTGTPQEEIAKILSSILAVNGPIMKVSTVPLVSVPEVTNPIFSPQVNTQPPSDPLHLDQTKISFHVANATQWSAGFYDSSHTLVRSFSGSAETAEVIWNGKRSNGSLLGNGVYTFEVAATGAGGAAADVQTGSVEIDRTPPTVAVTSPSGSAAAGPLFILGTATDQNFDEYHITIKQGVTTYLDQISPISVQDSALAFWNATANPSGQTYTVTVNGVDRAGNTAEAVSTFVLNAALPFEVLQPTEGSTISQYYPIHIRVLNPSINSLVFYADSVSPSNLIDTDPLVVTGPGVYTQYWNTMPSTDGPHTLIVQGKNGNTVIHSDSVSVTILQNTGGVTLNPFNPPQPNPFRPLVDPGINLSATATSAINWQVTGHGRPSFDGNANLVFDSGVHQGTQISAFWDGRDTGNQFVGGGVYDFYVWLIYDPNVPQNRFMLGWAELTVVYEAGQNDPSLSVQILLPESGSEIRGKTMIQGAVTDGEDSFVDVQLQIQHYGSTEWKDMGGTVSAEVGRPLVDLGVLDTMRLPDGIYSVRAMVTDNDEHTSLSDEYPIYIVRGGLKLGRLGFSILDAEINIQGFVFNVIRRYDSLAVAAGQYGKFGLAWFAEENNLEARIDSIGRYDKVVTLAGGAQVYFLFVPEAYDPLFGGGGIREAAYVTYPLGEFGAPTSHFRLIPAIDRNVYMEETGQGTRWFHLENSEEWDPDPDELVLKNLIGETITFYDDGWAEKAANPRGIGLVYCDDGVYFNSCASGQKKLDITYEYGFVKRISGLGYLLEYDYSPEGRLEKVKFNYDPSQQKGRLTVYGYNTEGYLETISVLVGWNGSTPIMEQKLAAEYDPETGDASSLGSPGGLAVTMDINDEAQEQTTYDALGRPTTVHYSSRGLVDAMANPVGGTTTYEYDENDNLIRSVDHYGGQTRYEYGVLYHAFGPFGYHKVGFTEAELYAQVDQSLIAVGLVEFVETWNGIPEWTRKIDPDGLVTERKHNKLGLITEEWNNQGSHKTYVYSPYGELLEAISNGKRTMNRTISEASGEEGLLAALNDEETGEAVTTFEYMDRVPTAIINNAHLAPEEQTRTELVHDSNGRPTGEVITGPNGTQIIATQIDEFGNMTHLDTDDGGQVVIDYRPGGTRMERMEATGEGAPSFTDIEYFAAGETLNDMGLGQIKSVTNPVTVLPGQVLQAVISFDADGSKTEVEIISDDDNVNLADNPTRQSIYDPMGNLIREQDEDGNVEENVYNDLDQVKEVKRNGVVTERHVYDTMGKETYRETIRSTGTTHSTTWIYDDETERIETIVDSESGTFEYSYFPNGWLQSISGPDGTVSYSYTGDGKPTEITYPDGTSERIEYVTDTGFVRSYTDREGLTLKAEYGSLYRNDLTALYVEPDPLNPNNPRLDILKHEFPDFAVRSDVDADGYRVTYDDEPDEPGARRKVTRHRQNAPDEVRLENFEVAEGTPVAINLPSPPGGSITYQWSQVTIDFDGSTITEYSDIHHRLVARRAHKPDGTDVWVRYGYIDLPGGEQEFVSYSAVGTMREKYDALARLVSVTYPDGKVLGYQYENDTRRIAKVTITDGAATIYEVTYAFNPDTGYLASVGDAISQVNYVYDAFGRLAEMSAANGVTTYYDYDAENRVRKIRFHAGAAEFRRLEYDSTSTGRAKTVREFINGSLDKIRGYSYDPLYRLTEEKINGALAYSYTYTPGGDRLTKTDHTTTPATVHTYTYEDHRLIREVITSAQSADYTYGYDGNGNLVEKRHTSGGALVEQYGYDAWGRLNRVETEAGPVVEYFYTPEGLRIERRVDGLPDYVIVDANRDYPRNLMVESGTSESFYLHGADRPLVFIDETGNPSYLHGSRNHDIEFLTSGSGSVTDTYGYTPFGVTDLSAANSSNRYLFAGEFYDSDAKLYRMAARDFQPETGRWLKHDSFAAAIGALNHPYTYARQDPRNVRDPSGQIGFIETLTTIGGVQQLLADAKFTVDYAVLDHTTTFLTLGMEGMSFERSILSNIIIYSAFSAAFLVLGVAYSQVRRFIPWDRMQSWLFKKLSQSWIGRGAKFFKSFIVDRVLRFFGRRGVSRQTEAMAPAFNHYLRTSHMPFVNEYHGIPMIDALRREVADLAGEYTQMYLKNAKLRNETAGFISKEWKALSENETAPLKIREAIGDAYRRKGRSTPVLMLSDVGGDQVADVVTEAMSIPIPARINSNGLSNGANKLNATVINDYLVYQIRNKLGDAEASRFVQTAIYGDFLRDFITPKNFPGLKPADLELLNGAGKAAFYGAISGPGSVSNGWASAILESFGAQRSEIYSVLNFRQKQLLDHLFSPIQLILDTIK